MSDPVSADAIKRRLCQWIPPEWLLPGSGASLCYEPAAYHIHVEVGDAFPGVSVRAALCVAHTAELRRDAPHHVASVESL